MPLAEDQCAERVHRGAERATPVIELRLLSGSLVFRNMQEFRTALRHRYVLANCAGLTLPAVLLLFALDSTDMPIDLQVPSVVVGLVAAQLLVVLYISGAVRLVSRLSGGADIVRVWVTPGFVLGAVGILGVAHLIHEAMDVQQDWTELRSHLIPFLCMLYLEMAATLLFRGPMPRALAELRRGTDFVPYAIDQIAGERVDTPQAKAPNIEPDDQPENDKSLIRMGINPADVLRLEASGNYVTVVTHQGRHLLPGPFSAVIGQMPAAMGRQVQRSHWVALSAVEGTRKKGRDLCLQIECGAFVPVSTALRPQIIAWLEAEDKRVPKRANAALRATPSPSVRIGTWTGTRD